MLGGQVEPVAGHHGSQTMDETMMNVIHTYSRTEAIEDGVLLPLKNYIDVNGDGCGETAIAAIRNDTKSLFALGELVITATASRQLAPSDVLNALTRHQRGDWGNCCDEDATLNKLSVATNERIFSVFGGSNGASPTQVGRFYIITEWNREATTILMPEDY